MQAEALLAVKKDGGGDVVCDGTNRSMEVEMDEMEELRFEASNDVKLQVIKGRIEYFGIDLSDPAQFYNLRGRGALFTWKGCVIRLYGKVKVSYKGKNNVMVLYANLHVALNHLRWKARNSGGRGPVLMLAGPSDTGKSSLSRFLLNYAVQTGWRPVFADVDVGQNDISMPAAIGATIVTHPIGLDRDHNPHHSSIYPFGHTTPSNNLPHYHHIISKLAEESQCRLQADDLSRCSGVVINTCGWVTDGGFKSLLHTAHSFNVDRVVVMGDAGLFSSLSLHHPSILLPSSPAAVKRSKGERFDRRQHRLHAFLFNSHATHNNTHLLHNNIHPTHNQIMNNHTNPSNQPANNPSNQPANNPSNQPANNPINQPINNSSNPTTNHQPTSYANAIKTSNPPPSNPISTDPPYINPHSTNLPTITNPTITNPTITNPTNTTFNTHPSIFQVDYKSIQVFVLNDASHQYRDQQLLRIQINHGHTRMVVVLGDSPHHLTNCPLTGVALILEVGRDAMLLMTSSPSRPPCMLLMPSLHYNHPIPPLQPHHPPSNNYST